MPALNKKIRRNIMRSYAHKIFEVQGEKLREEMLEYNESLFLCLHEYYSKDILASAKTAGIKLLVKETTSIPLRTRGEKKKELPVFDVNSKGINIDSFSYPGDKYHKNGTYHHYETRKVLSPEQDGSFYISSNWGSAIRHLVGCSNGIGVPTAKLPQVDNVVKIPTAVSKALLKRADSINKTIDEVAESLVAINTIIFSSKTSDALKGLWPEGASIINHAVVASTNTLPAIRIRQACKIANLK